MSVRALPSVSVRMPVRVARYQSDAVYGPRRLADYELVWLLTGQASRDFHPPWGTNERTVLVPGLLSLAVAGTDETYVFDHAEYSTHAFIHFRLDDPDEADIGGRLGPARDWPSVVDLRSAPALSALCQYTLDLAVERGEGGLERTQHCVALMLDMIVREPVVGVPRTDPRLDTVIEQVAVMWARDGMGIITGERLARAVGMSRGHLQLLVAQRFGCGLARMLELVRLAHAAVMLQRSNATIAEVSAQCGFVNPYHFSHRFKQLYREPPSTFRRDDALGDPYRPLRDRQLLGVAHRLLQVRTWS